MEGPPLGPGGQNITWPYQVAPRGQKASSTRKIKPQTSNLKPTPTDPHETRKPPSIAYDTLTVGNTSIANTHGTTYTTTANPTNDVPRCRHLQHPYHHHQDPGTE